MGIVLLRIDVADRDLKWPRLKKLIDNYAGRLLGHLVVVGHDRFRFRPLVFKL